jgi:RimJ/RimL family protein N-acetyltransferase
MSADTSGEHARLMVVLTGAIELRELNASDGDVLDEVFAGLSDESRFLRYLTSMPTLHAQARRVLSAVDGSSHVAVAAFADGKALGLARIVGDGGHRGELAVEVVDAWQGRGVGTRLGHWIRDRAEALGYTELVAETSAGNLRAQALMRRVFPDHVVRREGTVTVFTMPVRPVHPAAA